MKYHSRNSVNPLRPIASAMCALGLATLSTQLYAANFAVTNNADSGAGSLREAVADANTNAGPDTITFNVGVTNIVLLSEIDVTDVLTITGNGVSATVISGNNATRIFDNSSDLTLRSLTLTNGSAPYGGGAILSFSYGGNVALSLDDVLIRNSTTSSGNGGAVSSPQSYGGTASLTITNSSFTGNSAPQGAGGAINVRGGYGGSVISITRSYFNQNTAGYGGGAVVAGGAYGGTVLLDQLVVTNNSLTLSAYGGGGAGILLDDPEAPNATVSRSYFANNTSLNPGGGLSVIGNDESVLIVNNTFTGNSASYGGGIYLDQQITTITLAHNTVTGNTATSSNGGGVFVSTQSSTNVAITNNIVVGNSASSSSQSDVTLLGTSFTAGGNVVGNATNGATSFPAASGNQTSVALAALQFGSAAANGATAVGATGNQQTPLSLLLGTGSVAINAAVASSVVVDQRGVARPQPATIGGAAIPDVGAVEVVAAAQAATQVVPMTNSTGLGVIAALLAFLGSLTLRRRR
jgi:hypothetical protein